MNTLPNAFHGLPATPQAGVCLHVSSLPGPFGIGELGAHALAFIDSLREMQLGVWQFLPLGPTAYGDSPYQPLSAFAGNELFIDCATLIEQGLLEPNELQDLAGLPEDIVDYGALIPVKTRLLDRAARRFAASADRRQRAALAQFIDRHDANWLHDYALFRILKRRHAEQPWPAWEPRFVHREAAALEQLTDEAAADILSIKIIQFLFFQQWQRLQQHAHAQGIRLLGDMPLYIALDSADAWARPDLLQIDRDGQPSHVAGVPPDYFSEDGQYWGNPLYAWNRHADEGYDWWIRRVQAAVELGDLVRIDHFRGFEGYWAIPADAESARAGRWIPGPGDALFEALEEALGPLPIIAEDLGVITPEVEALRDRHGIPGMQVLQFAVCDPDFDLSRFAENSVCYTGTHDNDTTAGWFRGSPGDLRSAGEIENARESVLRATQGTPHTIHLDLIELAFLSPSQLAMAPMQDYLGLGSEARLNTPGTSTNNWRWRLRAAQIDAALTRRTAAMVIESGRGLPSRTDAA